MPVRCPSRALSVLDSLLKIIKINCPPALEIKEIIKFQNGGF
jgi:hypothetical protein